MREQEEYCKESDREEQAIITLLQIAEQEIMDVGQLSHETKQRIFAAERDSLERSAIRELLVIRQFLR